MHNIFPQKMLWVRVCLLHIRYYQPKWGIYKNKRDNRPQTMDHTALGRSFDIANFCEKNNDNVQLC